MVDPILFQGGPLDGIVWVSTSNDPIVRIRPELFGEPDIVYEDTGMRSDDGERIYDWDDR